MSPFGCPQRCAELAAGQARRPRPHERHRRPDATTRTPTHAQEAGSPIGATVLRLARMTGAEAPTAWHPTTYTVTVRLQDIVTHNGQPSYRTMADFYLNRQGTAKVLHFTFHVLPGGSVPAWNPG